MTYSYPFWYILLSILIASILTFITYKKNYKTSWEFKLMAFFRFSSYFIILFAIGSLFLNKTETNIRESRLVLAYDNSESMKAFKNLELIDRFNQELTSSELESKFIVEQVKFATSISDFDILNYSEKTSDFSLLEDSFDHVLDKNDNLLIISDGIQNSGKRAFVNPKAYKLIYLSVLDTNSTEYISVNRVNYNSTVLENSEFYIEVFLESSNYNLNYQLELLDKDKVVSSEKSKISSLKKHEFRKVLKLKSGKKGFKNYKLILRDNTSKVIAEKDIRIEIVSEKGKVLLLYSELNPEISLLNRVFQKHNYNVYQTNDINTSLLDFDFVIVMRSELLDIKNKVFLFQNSNSHSINNLILDDFNSIYSVDRKKGGIELIYKDLWKESLLQAKLGKNDLLESLDGIVDELEDIKKSKMLNLDFKSIYSSSENIEFKLYGDLSTVQNIEARARVVKDTLRYSSNFVNRGDFLYSSFGNLEAGNYKLNVYLADNNFKEVNFSVVDFNLEQIKSSEINSIAKRISRWNNSHIYNISEYEGLIDKLSSFESSIEESRIKKINIIDLYIYPILALIFLSLEWFLRRRNALY